MCIMLNIPPVIKQTNCSCLSLLEISINTIKSGCSRKEICRGDKYAYCANGTSNLNCFIIYKKVNINEQLRIGNCLSVSVYDQRSSFTANPCGEIFKPLCKGVDVRSQDWISSFSQCKLGLFVSYDIYKESQGWNKGHFWLANLRRPIINHSPEFEPKYCIAVSTQKGDPQVSRHVRQCNKELPVLCAVTNMTSSDNKPSTMSVEVPGLESDANTTNNILLVALVITAVLDVVVIIAVIVLCIRRRTSSRSGHQPIIVPTNEVTYAMVNKPTKEKTPDHSTRNNPADDTYDHMEHHRLSQNQNPSESNYDTMQSVGLEEIENDYDVTSETDRPKQIVLDDTAEYSHVKVEHLEIKDSPT
ncbi:unnamed protein product [Mytilus coruscus]|uniref:C-type lectin domain-containing protein n=1 Tax=Mytilus coruscus TaxID=42192 RepID=A0A6J8AAD2_MYTCO|nr:unnamed protein product [Mytilus coruscus]